MKPNDSAVKKLINAVILILAMNIAIVTIGYLINIYQEYTKAETQRSEKTAVLNVEKSSNLFGTSVAYIVKNPVGTGNISVDEHGSFARYNKGDKIEIVITKYKHLDDEIELKN